MKEKNINIEILNSGLSLAMDFGSDWLKPIHSRLAEKFPTLSERECNNYDKICRKAMRESHRYIYTLMESAGEEKRKLSSVEIGIHFRSFLEKKFSWVDDRNFSHLLWFFLRFIERYCFETNAIQNVNQD